MRRLYQLVNFFEFSSLLGMQREIKYFTVYTTFSFKILQNLILGNMIEHDRMFIFVYVNFLFKLNSGIWVDAGPTGVCPIGGKNKSLFRRGDRAVGQ